MVSGFLTSPFDHVRIESAVARPIRSWSKLLTSSMGIPSAPLGLAPGVFLVAATFGPGEVDAEFLSGAEDVLVELTHLDLLAGLGEDLDVEAQGLHLLDEDLEALGDAGLGDVLALDDGLVDLHAAEHVVGLDGEQLLQAVGGAVGLEGPHLHLAEPLATELGLPAEGLLGDHRVGAGGPGVDLVVHEVGQLQDVYDAHRDGVVVGLTGTAVEQRRLAVVLHQPPVVAVAGVGGLGLQVLEDRLDGRVLARLLPLVPVGAVEDRGGDQRGRWRGGTGLGLGATDGRLAHRVALDAPAVPGGVAEVRLEDLAHVHAGRDAEGVEDDVDGGAVGEEGHVLQREDLGDDALVAVAAGQLVADADLALLGHVDPDQLVHAGGQLVALVAAEHLDVDDLAGLAVGDLQRGVAHLTGLLTEDRPQQPLLGGQLGLALGGDLADEDVAGVDLGADADDAALVEVGEDLLGDVRDVPGDLLGAELGVAGVDLELLDVDRGQDVVLHEALRQDDRVLVVVALPRHEGDEQVLAQRHLALVGARTVGDDLTDLDPLALLDDRGLVDRRPLVRAAELEQAVGLPGAVFGHDRDVVSGGVLDHTGLLGHDDVAGVDGGTQLHAGAHERGLGTEQRDGLTLHVRAHERAVGVVVLEERDHRRGDRGHLPRRDVHVVDVLGGEVVDLTALGADQDALLGEATLSVERAVG